MAGNNGTGALTLSQGQLDQLLYRLAWQVRRALGPDQGFTPEQDHETLVNLSANPKTIAAANGNRNVLILAVAGGVPISVGPTKLIGPNDGIVLSPGMSPLVFTKRMHGTLPTFEWLGYSAGGGLAFVIELLAT